MRSLLSARSPAGGQACAGMLDRSVALTRAEPTFCAQAIEAKILEMKRNDLLSKYTSEALLAQQSEAKSLLNKKG
jgi:hypothetical protein